jgi:hypothetical protein
MTVLRTRNQWRIVALTILCQAVATSYDLRAEETNSSRASRLDVDVAVNGVSFRPIFAGPPTADGLPPKGTTFIINGVIYPAGTFASRGLTSGLLPDGSPEFPGLVIGTWTCRGWFSEDLLLTTTGAVVATTQIFDFKLPLGREAYFTEGFEPADVNNPLLRLILGGTARFGNVRGQHVQTVVGFNATNFTNYTFRHRPGGGPD